jgi:hypothetical protein
VDGAFTDHNAQDIDIAAWNLRAEQLRSQQLVHAAGGR